MYWIALITWVIFAVLLYLARKEGTAEGTAALMKPFHKTAMYLYKKSCLYFPRLFTSPRVEKDLQQLHPCESGECLKAEYYVKKIAFCLVIVVVGTLFGAGTKLSAGSNLILGPDGSVPRGDYREVGKEIDIIADYDSRQMDFRVEVEPRLLAGRDADELIADFRAKLPQYILGKNSDLENVSDNLVLREHYEGWPITVRWESGSPGILSDTGQIFAVEKAESVTLAYDLCYGGKEDCGEMLVKVTPRMLTAEETLYRELEELLLSSQRESLEQDRWHLPEEWKGERIGWSQAVEDNSLYMWAAAMGTAVLVYAFLDRDLHEQLEKRKKGLRRAYPEVVHKLVLFVGAGMTIRGAFHKIAGDYEVKRGSGGKQCPAYEEILYTCRELSSGVSEGVSYEHFGRRTGLQEYIRLSTLLAQNLKRGNSTLLERLREEADKAAEERLQQSKKLGEEAGTKLLVPMVLMLAVVMAIIMIPAFSNM